MHFTTNLKLILLTIIICFLALGIQGFNLLAANAQNQQPGTEPMLPETPYNYANPALPAHFTRANIRNLDNTPATNPVTDVGATLGRVLFYDVKLSVDDTVSCSSCHFQANGFTDPAQFSTGVNGQTPRNSMGLANNRYYPNGHFFWDERANTLEDQVLLPIQDSVEMGMTLDALETKLAATSYYPQLFQDAFGDSTITSERISLAMSQFLRSMVSYESPYDAALDADPPLSTLSTMEQQGLALFSGPPAGCNRCHRLDIQAADQPFNNGLDTTLTDLGVGGANGVATDEGKFKVPSLRNIELTSPYMHDGRFATLEEVVEFYNSGIQASPNLATELQRPNGNPVRLNLTDDEKTALVAFLKTLTDDAFIADEKFADPFTAILPTPTPTPTATPANLDAPDNVLLIIADDLGVDVLDRYGEGSITAPTPNLDILFDNGVFFRNAWSAPICSPTRATLLTGRYGFRTGVGTLPGDATNPGLLSSEFTLPNALDANPALGFAHANIGKWHLSTGQGRNAAPINFGYNHYAGSISGGIGDYFNWTKVVDGVQLDNSITNYATTENVDDAISWLTTDNRQNEPWFLWLAFNAPHSPFHKPPNELHSSDSLSGDDTDISANTTAYYNAAVEAMDTEIGRLLGVLPDTVRANTTVIFIGDNGTPSQVTELPFLRGRAKGSLYEGGINVPLLISGPRVVNPNRESSALVNSVDVFATALELMDVNVNATLPSTVTIDSVSMMPYIEDTEPGSLRDWIFSEKFAETSEAEDGKTIRNAQYKLIRYDNGDEEFYDLSQDSFEGDNLLENTLTTEAHINYCELTETMNDLLLTEPGNTVPALPAICTEPIPTATPTPTATSTATPTSTPTPTNTTTATPTITPTATSPITTPSVGDGIYFSSTSGGIVDGVRFNDEDIVGYLSSTGTWQLLFDGSDVGLADTVDVDAFAVVDNTTILVSLQAAFDMTAVGLGLVDDADILQFTGAMGDTTSGSWSLYFDGSEAGLTNDNSNIDGLSLLDSGEILISLSGSVDIPGISQRVRDEDILLFSPNALGEATSGSWSMFVDGSDVGLADSNNEDVWGVSATSITDELYLTTRGSFSVSNAVGAQEDIFTCGSIVTGDSSTCTFASFWSGATVGISGERLDAVEVRSQVISGVSVGAIDTRELIRLEEDALDLLEDERLFLPLLQK
ncbi:MAG: cytochrome c peroxidase [Chloroflexota bacterium]